MNQKDAVYEAVKQLKPTEVDKDDAVVLTKQEKKVVEAKLFEGFRKKKIQYNNELPSDDKLEMYVSGLVSNWLRKDRRLNGNRNYVPKRPGSRSVTPAPLPAVAPAAISPQQPEAIKTMAAGGQVTVFVVQPAAPQPAQPPAQQELFKTR